MSKYEIGVKAEEEMLKRIRHDLFTANIYNWEFIRDVCYRNTNGKYSQIDSVFVAPFGVFCVEFKSWDKRIIASKDYKWRVLDKSGNTLYFDSPIYQNSSHTKCLQAITWKNLEWVRNKKLMIHNLVVFDDKTIILQSAFRNVINCRNFLDYVRNYNDNLSRKDMQEFSQLMQYMVKINKPKFESQHESIIQSYMEG